MSKPAQLSGSGYGRAVACSAAYALPHVDSTGDAAERGTAIHDFIATVLAEGREYALQYACSVEHQSDCEAIDTAFVEALAAPDPAAKIETALIYDTVSDSVREVVGAGHREYGDVSAHEIPMTLDLVVHIAAERKARVYDWKSGRHHDPAQLRIAALAVARWLGVDTVEVAFAFLQSDGSWQLACEQTFTAFDFDEIADEARTVVANVARDREALASGLMPVVSAGDHCGYCGAKGSCPEFTRATTALVPAMPRQLAPDEIGDTATDADCAYYWENLERAQRILDAYRDALERRARVEPFTLPTGEVVQAVETPKRYLKPTALQVIRELRGDEYAWSVATTTATALGKDAKTLMPELEQRGAVETKVSTSVRAVAPKAIAAPRKRGGKAA